MQITYRILDSIKKGVVIRFGSLLVVCNNYDHGRGWYKGCDKCSACHGVLTEHKLLCNEETNLTTKSQEERLETDKFLTEELNKRLLNVSSVDELEMVLLELVGLIRE